MTAARAELRSDPATLGRRVGAYLIDATIGAVVTGGVAGILFGVSFATGGSLPLPIVAAGAYAAGLVWFLVYTAMQGRAGSIGMRLLRLRLRRQADGSALGFWRGLARNAVWAVGSAIVVGLFSPLFDRSPWRRGWHDLASGAVMTDAVEHEPVTEPPTETEDAAPAPVEPSFVPAGLFLPPADGAQPWQDPSATVAAAAARPDDTALPDVPRPDPAAAPVISVVPGITRAGSATPAARVERVTPLPDRGTPEIVVPPAAEVVVPRVAEIVVPPVAEIVVPPVAAAAIPPVPDLAVPPVASASARSEEDADAVEETRIATGDRAFAILVWDDGIRQAVYRRTLFGRNPAAEDGALVAPIRDETLSLSKTHFELGVDEQRSVWVVDRHSTNGVVVRRGTQQVTATAGERVMLHGGDVLEFGDRHVRIETPR